MKKIFLYLPLLSFSIILNGQTERAFLKSAGNAFAEKNYSAAYAYYGELLDFDTTNMDFHYRRGISANHLYAYEIAEQSLTLVRQSESKANYPDIDYWLGYASQHQGKYDVAQSYYSNYLSMSTADAMLSSKAKKYMESAEWAMSQGSMEPLYEVHSMGDGVNTVYSDYNAIDVDNSVYFSSLRFENPKDEHNPERRISKVLEFKSAGADMIPDPFNEPMAHTNNVSLSPDGMTLYFTICNYTTAAQLSCNIYSRKKQPDGSWGEKMRLPDNINNVSTSTTQPNVGMDTKGNEVLYFVSERTGGKGGTDIWFAPILGDNSYGSVENLSDINTIGDEYTPFYFDKSKTLFFSSDGKNGFGGFDVFGTNMQNGSWLVPENLGEPVNSSYNDIYYYMGENGSAGYLASNRLGSKYYDSELKACCYDLYHVNVIRQPKKEIIYRTIQEEQILTECLDLTDYPAGIDPLSRFLDPSNGELQLASSDRPPCEIIYDPKPGFIGRDTAILLKCYSADRTLCDTTYVIIDVTPIPIDTLYRTTKQDKPYEDCIKVAGLGPNLTYTICDEPEYGTVTLGDDGCFKYTPRPGFIGKDIICFKICDETGRCAKKVYVIDVLPNVTLEEVLPVELYFDNDRPDPRTRAVTTNLDYSATYNPYYARKETFVKKSPNPSAIDNFFEGDVRVGHDKLNAFSATVLKYLQNEQSLEIVLKGYTSPRASGDYNLNLAKRRIISLRNHFNRYQGGVLAPFIKSGHFKISEVAFGESTAPTNISDKYSDEAGSIYSVEASRERRIEIIEVVR